MQVVGIPDDRLLEVAAAYVELVPGGEATEEELIEHCRGRIASFKVPRMIRFIDGDEWPMSATKIQRFKLRDRLLSELEPPGVADDAMSRITVLRPDFLDPPRAALTLAPRSEPPDRS